MDINDIEKNLNNFEMDGKQILVEILNASVKNQAVLHVILENQFTLMKMIDDSISEKEVIKKSFDRIGELLSMIQAEISSRC